jgi:hypothetical protein
MFKITATNKWGDLQYSEAIDGTISYPMDESKIWVIKNPSFRCISYYKRNMPNAQIRKYKNVNYLLNTKAADAITGSGEVCVIKVITRTTNYFLLTIDSKRYIQNVQGGKDGTDGDTGNCIIREIKEELNINVKRSEIKQIGYWKRYFWQGILECNYGYIVNIFYSELTIDKVQHLIKNDLKVDEINIMDVSQDGLSETKYVLFVPEKMIEDLPDIIFEHDFTCQHRQVIHSILGLKKRYEMPHIREFYVKM